MCVCVCGVCACVRACVRACVCVMCAHIGLSRCVEGIQYLVSDSGLRRTTVRSSENSAFLQLFFLLSGAGVAIHSETSAAAVAEDMSSASG